MGIVACAAARPFAAEVFERFAKVVRRDKTRDGMGHWSRMVKGGSRSVGRRGVVFLAGVSWTSDTCGCDFPGIHRDAGWSLLLLHMNLVCCVLRCSTAVVFSPTECVAVCTVGSCSAAAALLLTRFRAAGTAKRFLLKLHCHLLHVVSGSTGDWGAVS